MKTSRTKKAVFQASRPSIPLPCVLAIACVIGVVAASVLVGCFERSQLSVVAVVLFALVLLGFGGAFFWRQKLAYWSFLFLIIGVALGLFQVAMLEHNREGITAATEQYSFTLSEDSKATTYGSQARATIDSGPHAGQRVLLFLSGEDPLFVGDVVIGDTRLSAPGDEYLAYYDQRGLSFSANLKEYDRQENGTWLRPLYQLRATLLALIGTGSDERTLLRAILLGERRDLFDAGFYRDIKVVGLAHLVAVSGAHLVIVTGFITLLLRRLRLPAKLSVAAQTIFLLLYLVLVGFPVSCIRAAIMSGVTLFALMAKRRSSSLTALGLTTLVMTALDPTVVFQLSFQLSVSSTLGIVLFMPLVNEWFGTLVPRVPSFVRETLSMTLAALMLSLPLSAAQFSTIPLISPLANLVATPYLTLLLVMGFAGLAVHAFAPFVLELLALVTKGLIACIGVLGSLPGAAIPVSTTLEFTIPLAVAATVVLWLWWPRPKRGRAVFVKRKPRQIASIALGCLAVLLVVVCVRGGPTADRIVMLNVGQGDSFALVSDGKTVLVDTGNEPTMLYAALARNNIHELDAVIITHPDDDHCGSLTSLIGVVNVKQVVIAEGLSNVNTNKVKDFMSDIHRVVGGNGMVEVNTGDTIRFGSFTLDVVAPDSASHEGGNEDSICFYARLDCDRDGAPDWKAFFCGDAEAEVLEDLASKGMLESVDLYKVGHHGSRKALSDETAALLRPKISLIGVGKNSYGHPTQETLDRLAAVGSQQYRSDLCGDVVCTFSADSFELSTERASS